MHFSIRWKLVESPVKSCLWIEGKCVEEFAYGQTKLVESRGSHLSVRRKLIHSCAASRGESRLCIRRNKHFSFDNKFKICMGFWAIGSGLPWEMCGKSWGKSPSVRRKQTCCRGKLYISSTTNLQFLWGFGGNWERFSAGNVQDSWQKSCTFPAENQRKSKVKANEKLQFCTHGYDISYLKLMIFWMN